MSKALNPRVFSDFLFIFTVGLVNGAGNVLPGKEHNVDMVRMLPPRQS